MPEISTRLRPVTSPQNALVKELRRAFSQGELTDDGYCAIESVRILEEAIRSGLRFKAVFFSKSGAARAERLMPQLGGKVETLLLEDALFASAVATEHPQGVAALVKLKPHDLDDALRSEPPLVVVAAGVQDPGNLGTIIRSAEAFGASGVVASEKTVNPFNAKAVRASAGSIFRLPVLKRDSKDLLSRLKELGLRCLATSSHKGTALDQADLRGPIALFVGGEGAGLPRDLLPEMDELLMIPHSEKVESLNAGIAASILLYEAGRQRRT